MITYDQVVATALALPKSRRNPSVGRTCAYTSPSDPEKHCIAGQILVDLGREDLVPGKGSPDNFKTVGSITPIKRACSGKALELLISLQAAADCGVSWGRARRSAGIEES